jgi:predicted MFS family arabinose efflux permease
MVLVVRAAPDAGRSAAVGSFTAFADLGFAAGAISLGAVAAATGYTGVFVAASLLAALGVLPLIRAATPRPSQQPGSGQSQPV